MNDPERLLEGGASDAELALLRAGASEEPPAGGKQRLTTAIGAAAALSTAKVASAGGAVFAKGLLLVASAAAVSASAYLVLREPAAPRGAPVTISSASFTAAERPSAAPPPLPALTEAPRELPSPSVKRTPPAKASATIAAEIAALDAARRALPDGRATLDALARYERDFPQGVLRQEAQLLRIEALARSGDRAAARKLAEQFLKGNPNSPHAHRVRTLVGLPE